MKVLDASASAVIKLAILLGSIADGAGAAVAVGPDFQVNTYTSGDQVRPAIAIDAEGDFVVVWGDYALDGDLYGIFARRFSSSGAALGGQFQVNTYTTGKQYLPAVAGEPDGDFVVVWSSELQDGDFRGVFGRRFTSAGASVGGEFQINTTTENTQERARVAVGATGVFVVAWHAYGQDGSSYGVLARRFASNGSPIGGELLVNTYTPLNQAHPAIAIEGDGDFAVSWQSYEQDGFQYGVFLRRFSSAGAAVGTELQVNLNTGSDDREVAIGLDDDGDAVVAWHSNRSGPFDVFARRFSSSGAAIGGELQVNSYTTSQQRDADVLVRPGGDFLVAWHSLGQDGSLYGIFGRRFSPAGVPLEPDFRVNGTAANQQLYAKAAARTNGDFVVVWESNNQDGYFLGAFGRRFKGQLADVDGNGIADPLTDGLLILRYLFGFSGTALSGGAIDLVDCTRCDASEVDTHLDAIAAQLDIDADGEREPLTDGLLLLRWLFGFSGATLTSGAVDMANCSRCTPPAITGYLAMLGP